jgi:hypothetical protein
MTTDGRCCRFPGPAREASLLQLPDAGRDEPEAVLLGGLVVELNRVAGIQGTVAVHLDCAEMNPCIETVRQIGRGNGPPALVRLEELDRAVRHDSRIAGQQHCGKWFPDEATLIDQSSARPARAYQNMHSSAAYRVSKAGERQGLNRDELYVNLGCLRKCVQVAGI